MGGRAILPQAHDHQFGKGKESLTQKGKSAPAVRLQHTHYDLFSTFVPITGNTVADYSNPISCLLEIQPASVEIEPTGWLANRPHNEKNP